MMRSDYANVKDSHADAISFSVELKYSMKKHVRTTMQPRNLTNSRAAKEALMALLDVSS